jgi:hypothetical protein
MTQWKIVYQSTPFAYTAAASMVIEAESKEAAFAVAYNHLTRGGSPVNAYGDKLSELGLDAATVYSYGVPNEYGACHVKAITEYKITAPGKVVANG